MLLLLYNIFLQSTSSEEKNNYKQLERKLVSLIIDILILFLYHFLVLVVLFYIDLFLFFFHQRDHTIKL